MGPGTSRSGTALAGLLFLLAVLVLDLCLWGQSSGWRGSSPRPESVLWTGPPPVKFLREREAQGEGLFRVLTVWQSFDPAVRFDEAMTPGPNEFALQPDLYMMHAVQNAAGYDGFGLARYNRLADDMKVWGDVSDHERSLRGPGREFDILNVRYLLTRLPAPAGRPPSSDGQGALPSSTTPSDLPPPATEEFGGQLFAADNLNLPPLDRGERLTFEAPRVAADRFSLLTNLSWSVAVPDGTQVGGVRLRTEDGRAFDFALRAGEHTSEWAHDRPDIRRTVRHKRAPVATSYAVEDAQGKYEGHTYLASFTLPEKVVVTGGEITVATYAAAPDLGLNVVRASLADTSSRNTVALRSEWMRKAPALPAGQATQTTETTPAASTSSSSPPDSSASASERWRRVAQLGNVLIYENTRALPRAWLASGAAVLDERTTLATIRTGRLPGGASWEPRASALVEVMPKDFKLSDANSPGGRAEVTRYEPNRVEVRTEAVSPSILVLAENHYPGWRAEVDGRAVETLRVNFNQRGVALPAGAHEVVFVYRPKSVVLGLLVSLLTAAALALWRFRLLPEERLPRVFRHFPKRRR